MGRLLSFRRGPLLDHLIYRGLPEEILPQCFTPLHVWSRHHLSTGIAIASSTANGDCQIQFFPTLGSWSSHPQWTSCFRHVLTDGYLWRIFQQPVSLLAQKFVLEWSSLGHRLESPSFDFIDAFEEAFCLIFLQPSRNGIDHKLFYERSVLGRKTNCRTLTASQWR